MNRRLRPIAAVAVVLWGALAGPGVAQPPGPTRRQPPPQIVSPQVQPDRRITFRLRAPQATAVRLNAGDIPGADGRADLVRNAEGVWEATVGPLPPGAYRYTFLVDGVPVVDPRSAALSESNTNLWSLVVVPGDPAMDTRAVPHGTVAEVTYYSTALKAFRRMHVYTPPGYESGKGRYPVFYLLHGAGDNDDAWSSVGRAGIILDNLIAEKKAVPMVVAMPAGHTNPPGTGAPDEFLNDFWDDLVPRVEKHYRVRTDRAHRAIAGLSMGGAQTLNLAIPHLDRFAYVGVYSSGLFGIVGPQRPAGSPFAWEEQHRAELDDAGKRAGLKLFWFGTGKDDFLLETTRASVALFQKHGFSPVYEETAGGHTWLVWRDYLIRFAPQLFR